MTLPTSATMQIGVRKQGRARGFEGPHVSITRHILHVPNPLVGQQLAVAVSVGEVKRALAAAGANSDELDTIEFMLDFERGDE